jgi:hypothetical protein
MKRLILIVLCLLLAFYLGWPLWSAVQLREALKAEDAALVQSKIDFPSVRASMRPAVTLKVGEALDRVIQQAGPGTALVAAQLKGQVLPQIVETTLDTLVTPQNVIRLANDAGPMKERIERIIREHMGKVQGLPGGALGQAGAAPLPIPGGLPLPGGLGQLAGKQGIGAVAQPKPAAQPTPSAGGSGGKQQLSLANVKHVAMTGPLGFEIGLAKDATAKEPDVTAQIGFAGFDWKLVGLVPRL